MSGPPIPTAKEIRQKSAEHGHLNMQLYVYFTTPTGELGPVMENLKEHLEYQAELERKGIMFGAGPHWDDNEEYWTGEGMVIVRANSLAEAREIAAADPMHKSGARKFIVRPWLLNEGCLTIKFPFSQGKRELI
ncbi:MAG: YciI family protein [bacterium]|nr:YciI family protein [bacterium]